MTMLVLVTFLSQALPAAGSHSPRHTASKLDRGLQGTPMAGTGVILEAEGRRRGISPYFMAAVAGVESSFGAASCSANRFNAWGLGSCDRAWRVPRFSSWREAVAYYARFLVERWPNHRSPWSFVGYCPGCSTWPDKVAYLMRSRFGVEPVTRYP